MTFQRRQLMLATLAVGSQAALAQGLPFTQPPPAVPATSKPVVRSFTEIARWPAADARQGIAVDAKHVYAVTDYGITKHDKTTGAVIAKFSSPKDNPVIHFDSAVEVNGKLYAGHSNYPYEPMTSSVEIFDADNMQHIGTHSFGIQLGSCTWIDRHANAWWGVFANYSRTFGANQRPYGNSYWTTMVKFDEQWQLTQGWLFPNEVIRRAEPMSISGGSWGPDGLLYATGHDHGEVYVLRIPKFGSVLELIETVPLPGIQGQGIAWDRSQSGVLWGIHRAKREVVASRMLGV
jgi:hypothetical protein